MESYNSGQEKLTFSAHPHYGPRRNLTEEDPLDLLQKEFSVDQPWWHIFATLKYQIKGSTARLKCSLYSKTNVSVQPTVDCWSTKHGEQRMLPSKIILLAQNDSSNSFYLKVLLIARHYTIALPMSSAFLATVRNNFLLFACFNVVCHYFGKTAFFCLLNRGHGELRWCPPSCITSH